MDDIFLHKQVVRAGIFHPETQNVTFKEDKDLDIDMPSYEALDDTKLPDISTAAVMKAAAYLADHYPLPPREKACAQGLPPLDALPTLNDTFSKRAQEKFLLKLDEIDDRIRVKLDQPFGKDNLNQCFCSEARLRHVLLPLWKSGFLHDGTNSWWIFCRTFKFVSTLDSFTV
jgi:hypothetical protein